MLSRIAFASRRSAILRTPCLISSNDCQQQKTKIQYRNYHMINSNKAIANKLLTEHILKNRNALHFTPARNISDVPVVPAASVLDSAVTKAATSAASVLPSIPDAPIAPVADIVEIVAGVEPTFLSLGLGGYTPIGIVQSILEYFHLGLDMPWWSCIALGTLCARILVSPVVVLAQRNAAAMHNVQPEMQKINAKLTEARQMGNQMEAALQTQELMLFMKEKGCSPLKNMLTPIIQAPVFISFFVGIRQMVNAPVESLETGGMFWFNNLTVADPYYILPLITSVTLWVTLELGVDTGRLNASNMQNMRYFLRAIPFVIFPMTMNFPAAMLCYWTCSNFISLAQVGFLKIVPVRNLLKIPQLIKHDPAALPTKKKSFIGGLKESWTNMKLSNELDQRRRLDEINFQRAGQGTMVKTYKYDPTKAKPARAMKQKVL